jgi:hypothetical protein
VEATRENAEAAEATEENGVRLDQVIGLLLAVVGLRFGIASLHDNSFFTHLATGRLIFDEGAIPSADPYSFTAFGTPWTVQSWGASVIYAGVEEVVGLVGIRVMVGLISAAIALLVWRLTEPAEGLVGRLAIAVPVVAIGSSLWVERPLIFSLLFLLGVLFALEGRLAAVWVAPLLWAWVNVHGSYPIGLLAIGCVGLGRLLDRERPVREAQVLGWAVLGTVLGGLVSPVGPRLLTFPFQLLGRRDAFAQIVEWQSPTWQDLGEAFFALQLALAVALILWRGRRWRQVVPVAVFAALSLQSTRNIVHASIVFVPPMAAAARGLGTIDARRSLPVLRPVRLVVAALGVLVFGAGLAMPDADLVDYPVEAVGWMRDNDLLDLEDRVVSRDFVGNYLEVRYGPDEVRVYIDDRVDMYPIELIADYSILIDPEGDPAPVLERAAATAVLWDTDSPFGDWLEDPANGWQVVHRERRLAGRGAPGGTLRPQQRRPAGPARAC